MSHNSIFSNRPSKNNIFCQKLGFLKRHSQPHLEGYFWGNNLCPEKMIISFANLCTADSYLKHITSKPRLYQPHLSLPEDPWPQRSNAQWDVVRECPMTPLDSVTGSHSENRRNEKAPSPVGVFPAGARRGVLGFCCLLCLEHIPCPFGPAQSSLTKLHSCTAWLRILKLLRLEKTSQIIKSNLWPNSPLPAKPCHKVPRPFVSWALLGMVTLPFHLTAWLAKCSPRRCWTPLGLQPEAQ